MAEYVWVKNAQGAEYAVVESAFDPEIHEKVDGAAVALDANGLPQLAQDEPAGPPAQSASKAEWVDYATSQGMGPDEAEAATKADLIATYGKEK